VEPLPSDKEFALSLVRDDPPFRVLRSIGLIPRDGLGMARRALFFTLLASLPIAIWAWIAGRAISAAAGEPLLQHFGVHVRCLVGIPVLIVAQGFAHGLTTQLLPWFVRSGVITADKADRFCDVVRGVGRLRSATLPWVAIAAIVIVWSATGSMHTEGDEMSWAVNRAGSAELGFGGWWFLFVARPIYISLVLGWAWRVVLLTVLFVRTAKLGLELVPTHPDGVGGLGFVERFATMFAPIVFVLSAALASQWAHQVLYHDIVVQTLRVPAVIFVVAMLLVFLAPLLVFAGPLIAAKRRAKLEYGALVGEHGDLVRKRWILHESVAKTDILDAPELGPVADTVSLYDAVARMRPVPIGKAALLAIAVPAVVPLLLMFALKVPIMDILVKLLHAVT
jgi:hypothetical protein